MLDASRFKRLRSLLHQAVANDAIDKLSYARVRELCAEAGLKAFADIMFDVCHKVRAGGASFRSHRPFVAYMT